MFSFLLVFAFLKTPLKLDFTSIRCLLVRLWVAWALKIWKILMKLCLLSKCGDYWWITHLYFYRVFSANYFPSGSIFDAKVALGSYAWQSIVKARKLVQSGLLWRVRNGMKINIYRDRWLPRGDSAYVVSPKNKGALNWVVARLMTSRGEGWNEQLVDALFLPFEAHRIKGIPLCATD